MESFEKIFTRILNEDVMSSTAFGSVEAGMYGNQFPSQNDKAYNPGDSRPINPYNAILGRKKKKEKNKLKKVPMQRRTFSGL